MPVLERKPLPRATPTAALDLSAIKRRAWQTNLGDGLIEIMLGLILLVMALGTASEGLGWDDNTRRAITLPLLFVGVHIIYLGKRYLTAPRNGVVRFGPERRGKNKRQIQLFALSFVLVNLLLILLARYSEATGIMGALVVAQMLFVFFLLAYYLDYPRFYIMGLAMASCELIYGAYRDTDWAGVATYGLMGLVVLGLGLLTLKRFMKQYPVASQPTDVHPSKAGSNDS